MNWLQQQLQNTPPPDTILHLGAGLCRELPHWLESGANRIVLVEPNQELLPELRARTEDHESVVIVSAAIAGQAGRGALRLFNFPLLSSLRSPTGLYQSLPGLREMGRVAVDLLTIEKLLSQLGMAEKTNNWLVIDAPGEEADIICQLLQADRIHGFSRVFLSAGDEALYEGAKAAAELLGLLEPVGFEHAGRADQADADWPRYHLRLDRMALECKRLKAELAEAKKAHNNELQALKTQLAEAEQARAQAEEQQKAQLAQNQQLESALTERKTTTENLGSELHERKKDLARLAQARDEAQQKLTKAEAESKSLRQQNDELQKKYRQLEQEYQRILDDQLNKTDAIDNTVARLGKSLTREIQQSRIQLESYIALNKYLDFGDVMPSLHGWTISPDLAMELVRLLESENYEMIIEFGSGSSTALLARCLFQQRSRMASFQRLLFSPDNDSSSRPQEMNVSQTARAERVLPDQITALEHHREYFEETRAALLRAGLLELVNLVYAPLKKYVHDGTDYLFYDCDGHLEKLANTLQRERSKILVLVDGPPGATNPHARFPALPKILEFFSAHELHVLMDDYARSEEKEIVEAWECILKAHSLRYKKKVLALEKGACLIHVE